MSKLLKVFVFALVAVVIIPGCNTGGNDLSPAAPTGFQVANADAGVILHWQPVEVADGYIIYRAEEDSKEFTLLGTTSETNFTDADVVMGIKYSYKVAGVNQEEMGDFTPAMSVVGEAVGDVVDAGDSTPNEEDSSDSETGAITPSTPVVGETVGDVDEAGDSTPNEEDSSDSGVSTGEEAGNTEDIGQEQPSDNLEVPTTSEVFNGYFRNPDYSNPSVFLYSGAQTAISDDLRNLATGINGEKDFSTLAEIYQAVCSVPYSDTGDKFSLTADEITRRGLTGCTDYGLVFAALARYKGIPTVFIQSARIDWVEDLQARNSSAGMIRGHILVEVFIDGEWYLVDSTSGRLYIDYDKNNLSIDDGYYVFAKSIEVWDAEIRDEANNREVMQEQFRSFDLANYQQPRYMFHDLRNLNIPAQKAPEFNPQQSAQNNGLVLIGDREPCEAFQVRYSMGGQGMSPSAFQRRVVEEDMGELDIIFFYTEGQWVPPLLEEEFAQELESSSKGDVLVKHCPEGKKRIFINIGTDLQENLSLIASLPDDYDLIGK